MVHAQSNRWLEGAASNNAGRTAVLTVNSVPLAYSRELGDAISHGRHAQTDLAGRDRVVPIKNFP